MNSNIDQALWIDRAGQIRMRWFAPAPLPRLVQMTALLILLAGCAGSRVDLSVEPNIPEPAMAPLPFTLGVHFDQAFRERVFEHAGDGWRLDTRTARMELFRTVLPAVCQNVIELPRTVTANTKIDGILVPEPVALQLAYPEFSPAEEFEAYVAYRLRLFDRNGRQVGEWEFSGYGQQSDDEVNGNREAGVAAAVQRAHRDLGARLMLGFPGLEELRARLSDGGDSAVGGPSSRAAPSGGAHP